MSTVKNYDAENFTSSEIEIKSGQNYDIKFKNAISGQIDWNVSDDNIAVNVYKTESVHTDAYRSYGYEKTEYGNKALNTEVLEKSVVTVDSDFVTNHSYIKVTQNDQNKYVIQAYEKTRTQNEAGEWSALSGETAVGDPSTPYDTIAALKENETYSSILGSFTDEQLESEILIQPDTKITVYTTTIYEATTIEDDEWQFGDAVSSVTKSQPEAPAEPIAESTTYAKVKYTQAWDANNTAYGNRAEVANGRAAVAEADLATTELSATRYIYSMTIAEYDFKKEEFGEAAAQNDLSTTTPLEHLTVYTRTSTKENSTTPVEGENLDQYTAFETYLQDNSATTDVIQLALDENSKKVVLGTLTLKNAATLGQDNETNIILSAYNSNDYDSANLLFQNPYLLDENYEVEGVPGTGSETIGKFFTGTSLNEIAASTAKDDTFNLGTGNNTININVTSGFGHDTVIGTEDEGLTVNLNGFTSDYAIDSSVSENGKDVILTVTKGTGEDLTTQGSITIQDYNVKNVFGDGFITVNTVNGLNIQEYEGIFGDATITGVPDSSTNPTKNTFTGTWRSETATTTALNDTINLGTGDDIITVKALNNGNDTVIANKDERLVLNYDKEGILNTSASNIAKIEVKGSDVVASTEVEYYALAKVDRDYVVDGHVRNQDESLVHISILDKLTDVKYDLITGATEDTAISKEAYDAITDETQKALYQFKEGTLKFTLQSGKGHSATSNARTAFTTEDVLYRMSDYKDANWSDLGDYADKKYDDTHIVLNQVEIQDAANTSYTFGETVLSGLKIYELINGTELDEVTTEYFDAVAAAGVNGTGDENNAKYTTFNKALLAAATPSTVTVKNALNSGAYVTIEGKVVTADVYDIDILYPEVKEQLKAANTLFEAEDVVAKSKKGKLDLSKVSNDKVISLTGLTSENGKGANIITKAGNDSVIGSDFNDTLNLKAGDNYITESEGVNKITTGKGDDTIIVNDRASATIKTSGGKNLVSLDGIGVNKYTGGNGTDTVRIFGATNTVKAGKKGTLVAEVSGGNNNITGGKKADDIRITAMGPTDSVNKINAGAGDDYIIADIGYNTITLGKGNDDIVINGGINVVKGTAGNNTYTIAGGKNVITGGKNVDEFIFSGDDSISFVNGGKGNDIYDLSAYGYGGLVSIKDTSGKNVVKLAEKDTILFDVTLGKNAKKDKVGKVFTFDNDGNNATTDDTVTFNGSIKKVTVGNTDYTLNVKGVAEQVASFMRSIGCQKGDSAYDVLAANNENAAKLLAIYQGNEVTVGEKTFSAQMYK